MTPFRRIEANRRNALRSTGPRTEDGKRSSRANAYRHGLTAETVVRNVEDAEDYAAFESAVIADYDARSAVERELVLRLASLLWRLRRATAVETDLLAIQAENLADRQAREDCVRDRNGGHSHFMTYSPAVQAIKDACGMASADVGPSSDQPRDYAASTRTLTYCFLRLANLDSAIFDRLSRYEAALWRQTVQTLFALGATRRS
jgi:hypothetical protein